MTSRRTIHVWFGLVGASIVAASGAVGGMMAGTGTLLLALSLAPATLLLSRRGLESGQRNWCGARGPVGIRADRQAPARHP